MSVDFVIKLPLSKGSDSILTVTDQGCTKAVILVPCQEDMGAEEIAELFKEWVFPYTGIPMQLISDHDTRFTLSWFKELCRTLGIDQNMSTAYHLQTDSQSERTNKTMEGLLQIFCNHQADDWAKWLSVVQYIINSRPSSMTKKAPYELRMGHIPKVHQAVKDLKVPDLAVRQRTLKSIWEEALLVMQHAQESWVKPTNYEPYKEGDCVWLEGTNLHTTHPTKKLGPKQYGPFKVHEVVGPVNFHLELPPRWKIHDVFHAKLLHPYKETEEHGRNFTEPPPDLIDWEPEWEVEQILDMRMRRSKEQHLIHWKGYSSAHDFWEPWENINAPLLMKEFEKRRSTQNKESAQKKSRVQQKGQEKGGKTIHSRTVYLAMNDGDNQTPPTPAHSISPDRDLIPSSPSLLSSNSRAVYYEDAAAKYGQRQRHANQEEEEVVSEDSASTQVSSMHRITNSLKVLALVHNETFIEEEDVVMDHM